MKVIIFGGSGFLGSHVADVLTNKKYKVVILDKVKSPYIKKGQSMVIGNILDFKAVNKAMKGCDIVYNFAGIADIEDAKINPVETMNNNVIGNTILLECARKNKIERFVFASSIYVYSHHGSFYRASKQACELFIESYHEAYGLNYTILRYGSLYGPRAGMNNWLYQALREALTDKKITRFGDGEELREYIHVEDAARLSVEVLSKDYKNECVILSGYQQIKIKDLLIMIKEMLNNKIEVIYKKVSTKNKSANSREHYEMTPYSFKPRIAKKIISHHYLDLGQGILSALNDLHREL